MPRKRVWFRNCGGTTPVIVLYNLLFQTYAFRTEVLEERIERYFSLSFYKVVMVKDDSKVLSIGNGTYRMEYWFFKTVPLRLSKPRTTLKHISWCTTEAVQVPARLSNTSLVVPLRLPKSPHDSQTHLLLYH